MRESLRMQSVQSPIIPVVAELIRNNPGTISLGQGVVGYKPPQQALDQIAAFLAEPENHKYKPVQGLPQLLEVLQAKLASENRIKLSPEAQVVVTAGGNMAFMNAILAIADPGDEVILQSPCYFNHEMAVTIAGCKPVLVPTDADYQLQPEAVSDAITRRTRAIVTISPNNPTGAVYSEAGVRAVNSLCRDRGLYHIHDEAYEYFLYDGARHFSPGSIEGAGSHTICLFSLSKAYGFASWRIGYMVIPESLFVAVKKIQDTILICPPVISQFAAVGALRAGLSFCREKLEGIGRVRCIVLNALQELSDLCAVPQTNGAFYFLIRLPAGQRDLDIVERLIREHQIAVIPGSAFGIEKGCYLRVAYGALQPDRAAEGIGRLVRGLKNILANRPPMPP